MQSCRRGTGEEGGKIKEQTAASSLLQSIMATPHFACHSQVGREKRDHCGGPVRQ